MTSSLIKNKNSIALKFKQHSITEKEVQTFVLKESGIRLPTHLVRRYLNERPQLS